MSIWEYLEKEGERKRQLLEYARKRVAEESLPITGSCYIDVPEVLKSKACIVFDACNDIRSLNNKILHTYPYVDEAAVDTDIKKLKDAIEFLNSL